MNEKTFLFIKEHEKDDVKALALQSKRYPEIDIPFALQQINGRKIAQKKIPSWYECDNIIYPKHISLEQCSSEQTARYKVSLCKGEWLVDLTGGMGVDFSFMSNNFEKSTYIEKQEELVSISKHNFAALKLKNTEVRTGDAEEYLKQMNNKASTLYIDPARRSNSGSKTVLINDCTPNLIDLEELIDKNSEQVMIKLSPMLDISQALSALKIISEVHIVSLNNECKELLLIKNKEKAKQEDITFHCINILNSNNIEKYIFNREKESTLTIGYTSYVDTFLYEPNASIIKAGAYKSIAKDFELNKLHPNSHLYTSEQKVTDFPGRIFQVKKIIPFNRKGIKDMAGEFTQVNITVRNFPLSVDEIRKKTKIKDGGEIYIFATTLADENKVLVICEKSK